MTKSKLGLFEIFMITFIIAIVIFISLYSSALIRFLWNNDCFEDFADEYCESLGHITNSVSGSAWYAWFDCTIDERHRTLDVRYYFTEQEMEECLG